MRTNFINENNLYKPTPENLRGTTRIQLLVVRSTAINLCRFIAALFRSLWQCGGDIRNRRNTGSGQIAAIAVIAQCGVAAGFSVFRATNNVSGFAADSSRGWFEVPQRQFAGQHFVHQHAERIHIGAVIDTARCLDLLRGEVMRRPHHSSGLRGCTAGRIQSVDLQGQPMKLSDYRGKVVVVSFWATWCYPCMKLIPHERELAARLADKPFAIVGVNGNTTEDSIQQAVDQYKITWRSFQDQRPNQASISEEWNALYPTVFLIDHKGVFRKRWTGEPPIDVLNRMVDELVAEAADKRAD